LSNGTLFLKHLVQ